MNRSNLILLVLPITLVLTATASSVGLFTLLSFPETVMRQALYTMAPEASTSLISKNVNVAYTDEVLDQTGLAIDNGAMLQTVDWTEPFTVGSQLSIKSGEWAGRLFIVTEVRRIGFLSNKIKDRDHRSWALIIIADASHPNGPKYRPIIEQEEPLVLPLNKNNAQAL